MKQLRYSHSFRLAMSNGTVYHEVAPIRDVDSALFGTCLLATFRRPDTQALEEGLFRRDLIVSMQPELEVA